MKIYLLKGSDDFCLSVCLSVFLLLGLGIFVHSISYAGYLAYP